MNKPKNPIGLIQDFLDKEETHEHLARVHNLVLSLYQKQNPKGAVKAGHAGSVTRWGTAWSGAHLRPMYRTVHRQVPRPMVLRAIRWVNPKRMFPIMNLTKEDMAKMDKAEFEKAFVELANYRKEAHVINNRYNQMLRMIDAGQLPYYIPYANITSQRYADLDKYRERAQRLGLGAADWGNEIDEQAEMFKAEYEKKHDLIDDIDGLWEDGKGEPAPPPFMRAHRRFKEDRLMRKQRRWHDRFKFTDSNDNEIIAVGENAEQAADKAFEIYIKTVEGGEREDFSDSEWEIQKSKWIKDAGKPKKLKRTMASSAQVWARQFIAVPEGEIRESESVRMPAKGGAEGAAAFLLRVPAGQSWMDDKQWKDLKRGKGPVTIGPKEALVEIHWSEVEDDDIDIRREQRWTQEGRIGGRKARHRGARSHQPGHRTEQPIRPIQIRAPQAPSTPDTKADTAAREKKAKADAQRRSSQKNINDDVAQKLIDLEIVGTEDDVWIDVKGAPKKWQDEGFLDPANIKKMSDLSGGVFNVGTTYQIEMKDGRKFVYKIAPGEQLGELLHVALDRGLGINVSPLVKIHNFGEGPLVDAKARKEIAFRNPSDIANKSADGGGHLMEWGEGWERYPRNTWLDGREYFDTPEKRATVWGTLLLDMITGNSDRHPGNVMVDKNRGILPIDNGFAGNMIRKKASDAKAQIRRVSERGNMGFRTEMKSLVTAGSITAEELEDEIRTWYKEHMDTAVIDNIIEAFDGVAAGNTKDYATPETVEKFVTAAMTQVGVTQPPKP